MENYTEILTRLPASVILRNYNEYSPDKVKRFQDKKTAIKRTSLILEQNAVEIEGIYMTMDDKIKKSTKPKVVAKKKPAPKVVQAGPKLPGPKSKFEGKKMYKTVKGNPRKEGTHGHKSWDILNNGMTYSQYVKAGGRPVDLRWDIARGRIELR